MTEKRIYEFAKEMKTTSKTILTQAKELGLSFGSHMSNISDAQQSQIKAALKQSQGSTQKVKKRGKGSDETQEVRAAKSRRGQAESKADGKGKQGSSSKAKPQEASEKQSSKGQRGRKQSGQSKKQQESNPSKSQESGQEASGRKGRRGRRRNRRNRRSQQGQEKKGITQRKFKELPESFEYYEGMNIQDISKIFHRDATEIIMKLMGLGIMSNQNQALSKDVIELIALEYGVEAREKVEVDVSDLERYFEVDPDEKTSHRPPVVTIMGHVDHGKTTLLDQFRNSQVTQGEAGGITQHIGAYQIETEGGTVTFLDTPGHEAFTTMRARGADVTDIAIIVVAADDGVMPQTVEAINHAKAADVPIIIAVNKMDKPTANPDRVKQELTEYQIIPEDWGGDNIFVEISALQNQNLDELLDMILLVAEVQELQANPDKNAIGSVIEARLDKAQGATATLLVQDGTLKVGDPIVVGDAYGRVRTMTNDQGRRVKEAGPASPVEITGLNAAPQAGDLFVVFDDEKTARQAGEQRAQQAQEASRKDTHTLSLDSLFDTLQEGDIKTVNLIIKADVQGSAEALAASLMKIEVDGVKVDVVHKAVGAISESDVALASATGAIIIGFNVRPTPQAKEEASSLDVDIRMYRVIYDAIDEVETAMKGMLDPEYEEEVTGSAIVRETYTVSKLGTIAGSYVTDGYISRNGQARLIRDNIVIFDGDISSLKRFQDDARQVDKGYECGIMLENFNDIKIDDQIEAYHMVEVKR